MSSIQSGSNNKAPVETYNDDYGNQIIQTINQIDDEAAKLERIERWLSPPDSTKNYQEAREHRQEGTCTWFFEGKSFTEWRAKPDALLWINGIGTVHLAMSCLVTSLTFNNDTAGSGKSVLW